MYVSAYHRPKWREFEIADSQTLRSYVRSMGIATKISDLTNYNAKITKILFTVEEASSSTVEIENNVSKQFSVEFLRDKLSTEVQIASNLVDLFENENTVPFIARYRRHLTGGLEPDDIRAAQRNYEESK